jgi:hypothetical protein
MKATSRWLGALLLAAAAASTASAYPYAPCCPPPPAPDACGPGFYLTDRCGCVYGPYYCVRPCFQPFNGVLLGQPPRAGGAPGMASCPGCPAVPIFPTHPYARGPRDFFMLD